jgi:membrane protein required for colicin V production
MNGLDVVLLIFIGICGILGLMRGLFKTVLPLAGVAIGVVAAGHSYVWIANNIFRSHGTTAYVIAFVAVVLIFLVAAMIVANVLHKLLKLVLLGWVDNLAGLLLGLVFACLVAGAILSLLLKYSVSVSTISDSAVASFVVDKFRLALALLPGDFGGVRSFFR